MSNPSFKTDSSPDLTNTYTHEIVILDSSVQIGRRLKNNTFSHKQKSADRLLCWPSGAEIHRKVATGKMNRQRNPLIPSTQIYLCFHSSSHQLLLDNHSANNIISQSVTCKDVRLSFLGAYYHHYNTRENKHCIILEFVYKCFCNLHVSPKYTGKLRAKLVKQDSFSKN